jgi:hypothetical protein
MLDNRSFTEDMIDTGYGMLDEEGYRLRFYRLSSIGAKRSSIIASVSNPASSISAKRPSSILK